MLTPISSLSVRRHSPLENRVAVTMLHHEKDVRSALNFIPIEILSLSEIIPVIIQRTKSLRCPQLSRSLKSSEPSTQPAFPFDAGLGSAHNNQ